MNIDTISQIGVAVLMIPAIILVARKNKWGFILGVLAQPFFFITTYMHKQWGLFLLALIYTGSWTYGVYEWFYKKK